MTEQHRQQWRQADNELRDACMYPRAYLEVALSDAERLYEKQKVDQTKRDELVDRAWARYERSIASHVKAYMEAVDEIWALWRRNCHQGTTPR